MTENPPVVVIARPSAEAIRNPVGAGLLRRVAPRNDGKRESAINRATTGNATKPFPKRSVSGFQTTVFFPKLPFLRCRNRFFFQNSHFLAPEISTFFKTVISALQKPVLFSKQSFLGPRNQRFFQNRHFCVAETVIFFKALISALQTAAFFLSGISNKVRRVFSTLHVIPHSMLDPLSTQGLRVAPAMTQRPVETGRAPSLQQATHKTLVGKPSKR